MASDNQTTEKPRFYGSAEIEPVPLDEHWNPLALAETRQQEIQRNIRVVVHCLEGHPHETYEAAAECLANQSQRNERCGRSAGRERPRNRSFVAAD